MNNTWPKAPYTWHDATTRKFGMPYEQFEAKDQETGGSN